MLECWRGKKFTKEELQGFDIVKVLGKACQLSIIHKARADGEIKARVGAVLAMPKKAVKPEGTMPTLYFTVEPGDPDSTAVLNLPEWLQKMVAEAKPAPKGKGPEIPEEMESSGDTDPPF
jgi:hypothetical protein